jgi:hypothetical protein
VCIFAFSHGSVCASVSLESAHFCLLNALHMSPLLLTHIKRVLQQSYTDIFAASVEQRQKWAHEIIGLHATVHTVSGPVFTKIGFLHVF